MFDFEKVVIWGYKIRDLKGFVHTHAWIHQGFYLGFQKLGYKTYWFDDQDSPDIDLSKSLFITMGNSENHKMPCRDDSFYIFHNTNIQNYFDKGVSRDKFMVLQVFTNDCESRKLTRVFEDDPYQLYNLDEKILYFPWATDLFPEDIKKNITNIQNFRTRKIINFVGMIIQPWGKFANTARRHGIFFTKIGGYDKRKVTREENQRLIQESYMAPSIQCDFQVRKGYIPCRIFKNISYGKFGITNSSYVNRYFNNELIYDPNVEKLFVKAHNIISQKQINYDTLKKHMLIVADKHTYLNRCQTLLDIFKQIIMKNFS